MNWTIDTRIRLARRIQELSLEIQNDEFARCTAGGANFPEAVENTIERIMEALGPLGFEKANRDWSHLNPEYLGGGHNLRIYGDSTTHLWFETAQGRIVKVSKENAEKALVLGFP